MMVNGLPGKMATEAARAIADLPDEFHLIPTSYTGPEVTEETFRPEGMQTTFTLIKPNAREEDISVLKEIEGHFIAVDFAALKANPMTPNEQVDFYCRHSIDLVMGATGGDRTALEERIRNSGVIAVVAPNMAREIVGALMPVGIKDSSRFYEEIPEIVRHFHEYGRSYQFSISCHR